jgi:hypothetical protein
VRSADPDAWSRQTAELRADETGRKFLTFFEFWFEAADRMMDQERFAEDNRQPSTGITPVSAMRTGLRLAESEMGFLTIDWIGQMLAVAAQHWAHGQQMTDRLTMIEHRVMEEALARKIMQLAEAAKMDTPGLKE